jgi:hypothetical protein
MFSYSSAAAAAPQSSPASQDLYLLPPSRSQLASLRAVPAALVQSTTSGKGGRGKRGNKSTKLVKGGRTVQLTFNEVASRPLPYLSSIEQSITVTLDNLAVLLITSSLVVPVYVGLSFALNGFDSYGEYTGLFDQYRFDQIEVWIEPQAAPGTTTFPYLVTCIDLDDASAPATVAAVQGRQNSVSSQGGAAHYHKWQPHMAVAAYSGSFTSYSNVVGGWIDSASPAVQHYGIKLATPTALVAVPYTLTTRAVVTFRAPGI